MLEILKKVVYSLFIVGIFYFPFNSWEGIKEFGEFKRESSSIFFILGSLILIFIIFKTKKIYLPIKNTVFILIILLSIWFFVTTILNLPAILDNYYKKTSGINRFLRQYISYFISAILFFTFYYYNLVNEKIFISFIKIRKVFFLSFLVVSIYGFLEISYTVFGFHPSRYILNLFDYFPFTEYDSHEDGRISSVTWEPPALATFLITCSPWMFSYIFTRDSKLKYIPTLFVFLLTYYSGSRTALIVVFIQFIIFMYFFLSKKSFFSFIFICFTIFILFFSSLFILKSDKIIFNVEKKIESLDFAGNLKRNLSNKSRFGIQYANLLVFKENPLIGVGFGQQGYKAIEYYPYWAKKNNYEFEQIYLNEKEPAFPPGYNLYIRILAESGIVGIFIFILLLKKIFINSKLLINSKNLNTKKIGITLYVSFIGFALNFLQLDTFRIYGFWLSCTILIIAINQEKEIYEK